jgi:hypothetical protein
VIQASKEKEEICMENTTFNESRKNGREYEF